jgi:hypothetical protein
MTDHWKVETNLTPMLEWINEICINLEDLRNRSERVQLMGRVYGDAVQDLM